MLCKRCGRPYADYSPLCPYCGMPTPPRYASFWKRLLAMLIDSLAVSTVSVPIILLVFSTSGIIPQMVNFFEAAGSGYVSEEQIISFLSAYFINLFGAMLLGVLVGFLYYTLMDASKMQGTLGKLALGIKITDKQGGRISYGRAVGRFFSRYISNMIPFYLGYFAYFMNDDKQTVHDLIAGTLVLEKDKE